MFTSPPNQRSLRSDLTLVASLAFVAGAANTIALRCAGVFAANMTGNVSLSIDRAATGHWDMSVALLALVVAFILGSATCAAVPHVFSAWPPLLLHRNRLLLEAAGMAALGCAWSDGGRPSLIVAGLAFLMGWQNALATTVSAGKARSTHLSGVFTDIGIDLAEVGLADGSDEAARARLLLGITTFSMFCLGGIAGVVSFVELSTRALLGLATILTALAAIGTSRAPTSRACGAGQ